MDASQHIEFNVMSDQRPNEPHWVERSDEFGAEVGWYYVGGELAAMYAREHNAGAHVTQLTACVVLPVIKEDGTASMSWLPIVAKNERPFPSVEAAKQQLEMLMPANPRTIS